jgi:hypothetical protein
LPVSNDDVQPFYDTNGLADVALNGDSDDYLSLGDQAQSLLLAAAFDKLNAKNNKNSNSMSKTKEQLKNLMPKTVTSKFFMEYHTFQWFY